MNFQRKINFLWPEHVNPTILITAFFVARFYASPGKYVSLKDTIRGFEIVDGVHDDKPEQAFYMVGQLMKWLKKQKRFNNWSLL